MARWKLLGGRHVEDGYSYEKGDVFESDLPLDTMFKNKFKETTESVTKRKAVASKKTVKRDDSDEEDVVVKDHHDRLDKPAPEYNQRKEADRYAMNRVKESVADDDEDERPSKSSKSEKSDKYGDDVTDEFETAGDLDLKVFKKGKDKYYVTKSGSDKKALSGAKPLKKAKVNSFLDEYASR